MAYTKLDIINQAFWQAGLASYIYDLTADQLNSALISLDMMVASWGSVGIRLGYNMPSSPLNSSVNDDVGTPDFAYEALYTNLSTRLCTAFGKVVTQDLLARAYTSYSYMSTRISEDPMVMEYSGNMPVGAGNKDWQRTGNPFYPVPVEPLLAGPDSEVQGLPLNINVQQEIN